jgi:hypothetical protein
MFRWSLQLYQVIAVFLSQAALWNHQSNYGFDLHSSLLEVELLETKKVGEKR